MEVISSNLAEEMSNNIKTIISDSFKQKNQRKPVYINKRLNELYSNEKWSVLFINQNFSETIYSFKTHGAFFSCKYKERIIIIYPSKITKKEEDWENDEEEGVDVEKIEKDVKSLQKISENIISKQKYKIEELEKQINFLINELKQKSENNPFNKTLYTRERLFALNFLSSDQKIHYAIPCLKKDLFVDVEKKLYEKFPKYKEKNYNFVFQGKVILRFKSVEENKLESGIPIIMPII